MPHVIRKATITTIATLGLLGAVLSPAAGATGNGNGKGAEKQSAATWTEDNDTNDGGTPNNVADDGDNRHPSGKDRSVEKGGSGNQGNATSDPDDDGRGPDRSNGGPDKPNGSGGVDLADQDGNNGCGNDDDFEDDNEGWCGRKPKAEKADKADYVKAEPTTDTSDCPKGMVDDNGSAAGGCECPDDMDGTTTGDAAGACGCPDGMIDVNGDADGGCVESEGAVLGGSATAGGAGEAEVADDAIEGEVLSASVERPASVTAAAAGAAEVAESGELFSVGGLAFTGANTLVLLAVALVLLAIGWMLLKGSRTAQAVARD